MSGLRTGVADLRRYYLYRIVLPGKDNNGYIGVSYDPYSRYRTHCNARSCIGREIRQHGGPEKCRLVILCAGPRDYIYALEKRAIKHFNTEWPNGCNRDAGCLARERLGETVARKPAHVETANFDTANSARILEFAEPGFYKRLIH